MQLVQVMRYPIHIFQSQPCAKDEIFYHEISDISTSCNEPRKIRTESHGNFEEKLKFHPIKSPEDSKIPNLTDDENPKKCEFSLEFRANFSVFKSDNENNCLNTIELFSAK